MGQEDVRNDLHLTSTGNGHAYKYPLTFPPVNFKVKIMLVVKTGIICYRLARTIGSYSRFSM